MVSSGKYAITVVLTSFMGMLNTITSMLITVGNTNSCPVCIQTCLVVTDFPATDTAVWLA